MSLIGKYKWLLTYSGLFLLKKALSHRVQSNITLSLNDLPTEVKMVNRVDFILDLCKNKRVLHIGFADHPYTIERIQNENLLHLYLKKIAGSLVGFDNNEEAVQKYISLTGDNKVIIGDLLQTPLTDIVDSDFDIVVLGEVLEHLQNPHLAVENIYQSFLAETTFLVTVPNHTSLDSVAGSLNKKECVHPDHYWYFSPYTLKRLFPEKKFELKQFAFGMYYQKGKDINFVLRRFPFMGDCIIAVFKSKK